MYRSGVVSVRDLIAPASFHVTPDFVQLGGTFIRTMFVINCPRYINVGWFAPIINMNRVLDVSMYFYPVQTSIILKQLKKKVGALEAQILSDQEKGAPRDPIRETALRDIERVGRGAKYIVVDTFRTEREKVNLMYWQLTCQCFYTPEDWQWWFDRTGYSGDHSFVHFE